MGDFQIIATLCIAVIVPVLGFIVALRQQKAKVSSEIVDHLRSELLKMTMQVTQTTREAERLELIVKGCNDETNRLSNENIRLMRLLLKQNGGHEHEKT